MRRGNDIAERLLNFAVAVVRLAAQLPRDPAGRHVASQIVRSATGGGANYEEARAAESREDFIHKVGVSAKEVRETVYWLEFIARSAWTRQDLSSLIREAGSHPRRVGPHRPCSSLIIASCRLPVPCCLFAGEIRELAGAANTLKGVGLKTRPYPEEATRLVTGLRGW